MFNKIISAAVQINLAIMASFQPQTISCGLQITVESRWQSPTTGCVYALALGAEIIPYQYSIINQKAGPSRTNSQKIAEAEKCRFQLTLSACNSKITFDNCGA
jgi:hypothetical protein